MPGILGSELVDAASGELLWGLAPRLHARAWARRDGLVRLAMTDDELAGKTGRVRPGRLLRFPTAVPILAGVEPYTRLVRDVTRVVAAPDAVLPFAYDWRLSVATNARLLATAAGDHLERWRLRSGYSDAQLVLVAHSMGGLLCQEIPPDSGLTEVTRAVITLGTPFDGAAKAAVLLNQGSGAPLPAQRLQRVAASMPGVHDLLPMYRSVDDGVSGRALTAADVGRMGGLEELAAAAFARHRAARPLVAHRAVIGIRQPTMSSLTIANGMVEGHEHTFRPAGDGELERDVNGVLRRMYGGGDGTVPRNSARPPEGSAIPLAQQHGALARSKEAIDLVCDVLMNQEADLGPRLGPDEEEGIGIELPTVVAPGASWTLTVTGVRPGQARCELVDAETGRVINHPQLRPAGDFAIARIILPDPGIYRVSVAGGGTSPVSGLVLAVDPADEE